MPITVPAGPLCWEFPVQKSAVEGERDCKIVVAAPVTLDTFLKATTGTYLHLIHLQKQEPTWQSNYQ